MATAAPLPPRRRTASIEPLRRLVESDLTRADQLILSLLQQDAPLIEDIGRHIIRAGGKRLRPALVIAAAQLCGYSGDRHVALAAAVEFLHTATLLHDDVVDESTLRRGQETANAIWSNQASVLVGDFLLSRAFQLMVKDGSLEVLALLSDASATISQGEVKQLMAANNLETTEADYLSIIDAKTAALFSAATAIGPIITGRPQAERNALATYGHHLGTAFQLVDDALDYSARQSELGKTVGDDFREGKMTLPVILAYAEAGAEEQAFWERTIGEGDQHESDLPRAIGYLARHDAVERTIARAGQFVAEAEASLGIFPNCSIREAMHEALTYCVSRSF